MILQADGKDFDSIKSLHDYIASKKPGDTIRLNVWSQGMKKFVAIKLGETPAEQPLSSSSSSNSPGAAARTATLGEAPCCHPERSRPSEAPSAEPNRRGPATAGPLSRL